MKRVIILSVVLMLSAVGVAWAGLFEAHQQALAIYKKTKDLSSAIRLLEDAGIKGVLGEKPVDMRKDVYVSILNDYGFFLAEFGNTSESRGAAIDVLEKVTQLGPDRAVAYLNLGDVFVKEIDANQDTGAKAEMRALALQNYEKYAQLLQTKKLGEKMPQRVQEFLQRAHQRGKALFHYRLAMNNDPDVCTHMLHLFNADWTRFQTIRFDLHQEFTSIPWVPMNNLGPDLLPEEDIQIAKFDINNDGRNDLVVKSHWSLRGKMSEELDVYGDEEGALPLKAEFGMADLKQSQGSIGHGGVYPSGKRVDQTLVLGARLLIYPFKYKNQVYISVKDRSDEFEFETYEEDVRMDKWHVVAKYKGDEETEDLCYFRLEPEVSKRKTLQMGERR
ncbi:MAG: exported protein of unknown function [Nitrospira sp.]|nr:MAG: exported protein of unknown function [Nitrospira sp.]